MDRNVREVKKVAEELLSNGEIEDFTLGHDKRHHRIEFKFKGKWSSIPFAQSPRTPLRPELRETTDPASHQSDVLTFA